MADQQKEAEIKIKGLESSSDDDEAEAALMNFLQWANASSSNSPSNFAVNIHYCKKLLYVVTCLVNGDATILDVPDILFMCICANEEGFTELSPITKVILECTKVCEQRIETLMDFRYVVATSMKEQVSDLSDQFWKFDHDLLHKIKEAVNEPHLKAILMCFVQTTKMHSLFEALHSSMSAGIFADELNLLVTLEKTVHKLME